MEPITMAMTAGSVIHAVYQLTKSIYTFVSAAASADQAIQSMLRELNNLRESTRTIETCLENPLLQRHLEGAEKTQRDELFSSIDGSLRSAQGTLGRFQQTLDSIRGEQSSLNPLRQPLIVLGLNFNAQEIMVYRAQITAHVHALMMGMQSMTVYATIQAPNIVISKLEPKLNILIEMVADLSSDSLQQTNTTIPEVERVCIEETTSKLRVASQQVISSAQSVTSRGSASGSSTSGQRLLSAQYGPVSDWNSEAAREARRESRSAILEEFDDEMDSEEETAVEFFDSVLREGHRRLQEGNTEDAVSCYRKALEAAEKSRLHIQPNAQYNDACLKLAQIHRQQKKFDEAKAILSDMLTKYSSVPPDLAEQIVDAWYRLAEIHLELKELKEAEEYCTKAMKARRRLDKTSDAYRDSVMLLAAIFDEKGDKVTAIGWRGMIPPATRPPTPPQTPQTLVPRRDRRQRESLSTFTTSTDNDSLLRPGPRPVWNSVDTSLEDIHLARDNPLTSRYATSTRHGPFEWTVPSLVDGDVKTLPQILESNAPRVIYKALEALDADLFTRPRTSIRSKKFDPHVALRNRIYSGHVEVAWLLLYKLNHVKAEWERRNRHFWSSKRPEFPARIDKNYASEGGLTFLEDACISTTTGRAKHDMVDLLLHYGVNVNPSRFQFVPLVQATLDGDHDLVEILLAHKADPNARLRNRDGSTEHTESGNTILNDTVLIKATELNFPKVVDALLYHSAQVDLASSRGTALCVAAEKGYLDIVKTLLEYDAGVNVIRPVQNTTPLCLAAKYGHTAVVRTLLNRGANVRHEVKPGYTAIVYAIEQRHHAIREMLRERGGEGVVS